MQRTALPSCLSLLLFHCSPTTPTPDANVVVDAATETGPEPSFVFPVHHFVYPSSSMPAENCLVLAQLRDHSVRYEAFTNARGEATFPIDVTRRPWDFTAICEGTPISSLLGVDRPLPAPFLVRSRIPRSPPAMVRTRVLGLRPGNGLIALGYEVDGVFSREDNITTNYFLGEFPWFQRQPLQLLVLEMQGDNPVNAVLTSAVPRTGRAAEIPPSTLPSPPVTFDEQQVRIEWNTSGLLLSSFAGNLAGGCACTDHLEPRAYLRAGERTEQYATVRYALPNLGASTVASFDAAWFSTAPELALFQFSLPRSEVRGTPLIVRAPRVRSLRVLGDQFEDAEFLVDAEGPTLILLDVRSPEGNTLLTGWVFAPAVDRVLRLPVLPSAVLEERFGPQVLARVLLVYGTTIDEFFRTPRSFLQGQIVVGAAAPLRVQLP